MGIPGCPLLALFTPVAQGGEAACTTEGMRGMGERQHNTLGIIHVSLPGCEAHTLERAREKKKNRAGTHHQWTGSGWRSRTSPRPPWTQRMGWRWQQCAHPGAGCAAGCAQWAWGPPRCGLRPAHGGPPPAAVRL
eukprot:1156584-Pelagomonas_calceolata.AAC.7